MEREKSYMELMIEEDLQVESDGYDDFKLSKAELNNMREIIMGEGYVWQQYEELISELVTNLYHKKISRKKRVV